MIVISGTIVSISDAKTMIVENTRRVAHEKYLKSFVKSKRFAVHTEDSSKFSLGDKVSIIPCAPKSKTKKWIIK
ncbi:mitochondrial small ribosomal subunit protein uS17m [Candidatus Gracilibacteria bacterium]|nr:mitochondrial small ribosomal subunit protein uS17m [Candidatus Gracilibacteria bacterium]